MENKKKRIIITVTNNLVIDQRVAKLAAALMKKGYQILLVGRTWPGGSIPSGRAGEVIRFRLFFNNGVLFYANYNIRLFFLLLVKKCDYIISVDLDTLLAGRIAGWLKRVPVILDSHEYFSEIPELQHRPITKSVWRWIEKYFLPGVDYGITVSSGIQRIYREKYGKSFSLIRNVPELKVPISEIRPVSDHPIIYYQGALNMGRGLEDSLLALKYLSNYRMLIVGRGDIEDTLHQIVEKEGLADRVTFTGKVPFEQLNEYASKAHVGLCLLENTGLSYFHSLPNRIFDYPAMGLPVVATNFPDISEVVLRYETGLLVDSLEPEIIAAAIQKACESSILREKWKTTLYLAARELNWEQEQKVLDEFFQSYYPR